jgi:hypothetical protein
MQGSGSIARPEVARIRGSRKSRDVKTITDRIRHPMTRRASQVARRGKTSGSVASRETRPAIVFYGIAFAVTALTFNAVWHYAGRHRLLSQALGSAGVTAIGRRFQLAVVWLATGVLLGALLPVLGVVVIAAFNAFYWLPIRGEGPAREETPG